MSRRKAPTQEQLIDALLYTYEQSVEYYKELGMNWRGLTRSDYMRFKRDTDPSYRSIENAVGSWSAFTTMVPVRGTRTWRTHERTKSSYEELYDLLHILSEKLDRPPLKIPYQAVIDYNADHPEDGYADWRTYKVMMGVSSWKEAKMQALELGKKDNNES